MEDINILRLILNSDYIVFILAFGVYLLTNLIKRPFKALTSRINKPLLLPAFIKIKEISAEALRKMLNKIIILMPFILAFLLSYIYYYILKIDYTLELLLSLTLKIGVTSIVLYAALEGRKKDNIYNTPEGKKLLNSALELSKSNNIIKDTKSAVIEFMSEEDREDKTIIELSSLWQVPPERIRKIGENIKKRLNK